MNENQELENVSEVMKESTLTNPELTFCEKTTYLDFLLSNSNLYILYIYLLIKENYNIYLLHFLVVFYFYINYITT